MADTSLGLPGSPWRERALIFNTQPARYLNDSWLTILPHGEMTRRLMDSPRTNPALSRYLLQVFGLEGRYVDDFSNPWARLALLDAPRLERLLRRLGLALHAPTLRLELSGERLRRLKDSLSEEDWIFVTREASLLGRIPDFRSEPRQADPALRFMLIGVRFCAIQGLAALDQALVARLALKLPLICASALQVERVVRPAELPPLLRKLLREFPPAWNPLCV